MEGEGGLLNSRGLCGLILALLGLSQVGCVCLVMSWSVLVSFGFSGRHEGAAGGSCQLRHSDASQRGISDLFLSE